MTLLLTFVTAALAAPEPPAAAVIEADGGSTPQPPLEDLVAAKREARDRYVHTDWSREMAIGDRDAVLAERRAALDELRRLRHEVREARREQRGALS